MARTLLTTAPVRFYTNERSLNKYKAIMNFNRIYDPQKREQNGYKIFAAENADIDFYASFLSQIEIGPRWRSITCLTRDESKIPAHQRRNDKAVWFIAECWPGQALDGAEFLVLQMPEETIKKIINGREESSERTYMKESSSRRDKFSGMKLTSKTKPIARTATKPVQTIKPITSKEDIDNAASALATAWGVKYNDK